MGIDWDELLYDPLYANFGTTALLTPLAGASVSVQAIDQTRGMEIQSGIDLPVIRPACTVRRSEMDAANLTEREMLGGAVTMNGNVWTIADVRARPGPDGKDSGESLFVLVAAAAGTA
jgi:hypothetical protein